MTVWEEVRDLISAGDAFKVAARVADLVEPVLQAVATRPAEWQGDLAVRLALRVRVRCGNGAPLRLFEVAWRLCATPDQEARRPIRRAVVDVNVRSVGPFG